MKKTAAMILAAVMCVSLSACITITIPGTTEVTETETTAKETQKETKKETEKETSKETTGEEKSSETGKAESSKETQKETTEKTVEKTRDSYIFPESDRSVLTLYDLRDKTVEELRIGRNEIYARHGRKFKDKELQEYFDSQKWYTGTIEAGDFDEGTVVGCERVNIDKINTMEQALTGSFEFDSYSFTVPECWKGKCEVEIINESLLLTYFDTLIVRIDVYKPNEEYYSGDPFSGNRTVGKASNGNSVVVCYDSVFQYLRTGTYLEREYTEALGDEMREFLFLMSGQYWDNVNFNGSTDYTADITCASYLIENASKGVKLK